MIIFMWLRRTGCHPLSKTRQDHSITYDLSQSLSQPSSVALRSRNDRERATDMGPTPGCQPQPLSHLPLLLCSLVYKIRITELTHSFSTTGHPLQLTKVGRGPEQARHLLSVGIGPLSMLPPWPGVLQKGGAQPGKQWQFWLLLQT